MYPKVAVILVNWNGRTDTLECLESLGRDTYPNKAIVVVDNGSSDGSCEAIRNLWPSIDLIAVGENLGFTGGNNVGIAHAMRRGAEYIYCLNNDTISEHDALTHLVKAARGSALWGILSPVIHYYDNPMDVWFGGAKLDISRGVALHDNSDVPQQPDAVREIGWASGCAMLIPSSLAELSGGFDERFFLNWEDVDLCLRVRSLGYKIGLVPGARIRHKVGRSFRLISHGGLYYWLRNNLLLLRQHGGAFRTSAAFQVVWTQCKGACGAMLKGEVGAFSRFSAIAHAVYDDAIGRYGRRW